MVYEMVYELMRVAENGLNTNDSADSVSAKQQTPHQSNPMRGFVFGSLIISFAVLTTRFSERMGSKWVKVSFL